MEYTNPNGKRTDRIVVLCPKTADGLFWRGFSPAEQVAKKKTKLPKEGNRLVNLV